MKNSPLTTFLLSILALSAVLSVISCAFYVYYAQQLRSLQGHVTLIGNRNRAVSSLVNESLEYSKLHPGIDPILEAAGFKQPKSPPAATNKPAGK